MRTLGRVDARADVFLEQPVNAARHPQRVRGRVEGKPRNRMRHFRMIGKFSRRRRKRPGSHGIRSAPAKIPPRNEIARIAFQDKRHDKSQFSGTGKGSPPMLRGHVRKDSVLDRRDGIRQEFRRHLRHVDVFRAERKIYQRDAAPGGSPADHPERTRRGAGPRGIGEIAGKAVIRRQERRDEQQERKTGLRDSRIHFSTAYR